MKKNIYIIAVYLFASGLAQATTYTWNNTVTGLQDWASAGNWTNSTPFVSGATNELRFLVDNTRIPDAAKGIQTIINVPTPLSMNTLTLNGTGPNSANATMIADIIIGDNTSTWTIGDGTTSTVNLNASQYTSVDRTMSYKVCPNIRLNQTTNTFTGNGTAGVNSPYGGFNFSGNITESAVGYGIIKSGTSAVEFSGANTYSGTTTLSGGILRLSNATALPGGTGVSGGTSALTINGGVLELANGDFFRNLGTGSDQFRITGGTSGFSAKGAHRLVMVNNDPALELVWGSASFAPSTLVLNAATANNDLWLANKINLNATNRTIQVNANTAILSGNIQNSSGTVGITKSGAGTLVLSGTNTYNGATTHSDGTLIVGTTNNLGAAGANLVFNGGRLRITGTSITNIASIGHAVTFTAAKAVGFDIADAANTFTVDQVLNQASGALIKDGAGTLVLNQNNTFTGATTVTGGGTLVLDYSTNNGSKIGNAALNLSGGNLVLRGGSYTQAVTSITIAGGNSISRDGGSTATIANAGALGASNLTIAEAGIVSATTANAASGIQVLGYVTVGSHFATKDGSNLLQAYSAYTNATTAGGLTTATVNQLTGGGTMAATLNSYSLRIANSGDTNVLALGANSLLVINGGTVLYAGGSDNNYTINGTSGKVGVGSGNQSMNMKIFTGTLTVNVGLGITGSGSLVKAGAGTLVVGGINSSGSATYIQQGVLRLANASGLGSTAGGTFVQGGAALELTNNITVGAEALNIAGAGISNGGALRNISGTNTYGGAITIGGGEARINSDSGTLLKLTGGITTTGGQNLIFDGAGNTTVSNSVVVGTGNLIKDGAGTLGFVVNNSSVYSTCGDMAVNAGKLQITFNVAPSATVPVFKILGDLEFTGTPTIAIAVAPSDITTGVEYPLLTVGGSAPTTVPTLEGFAGSLKWGGPGNRTLILNTGATGMVFILK